MIVKIRSIALQVQLQLIILTKLPYQLPPFYYNIYAGINIPQPESITLLGYNE